MENTQEGKDMQAVKQPEGWKFKDDYFIQMHYSHFVQVMSSLAMFEQPLAIMNTLKNKAIEDGGLLPFFESDILERVTNERGQIIDYKLREDFGKASALKKESNALILDSNGQVASAK